MTLSPSLCSARNSSRPVGTSFYAQPKLPLFLVDGKNLRLDLLAEPQSIRRVIKVLIDGDLADVDHTFDAFGDLQESSELGEAHDGPFNLRAGLQIARSLSPRVSESLLEAKRDAALCGADAENDRFHGFAGLYYIGGFADLLAPGHF